MLTDQSQQQIDIAEQERRSAALHRLSQTLIDAGQPRTVTPVLMPIRTNCTNWGHGQSSCISQ